jgi:hypothetical protein
MSWIFGAVGEDCDEIKRKIKSFLPEPITEFNENNLVIAAGGKKETCNFTREGNFIAAGVGISTDSITRILTSGDWANIADGKDPLPINGHYVFIKWNNDELSIFTDRTGLRDIHLYEPSKKNFIFSTRADWLAEFAGKKLNFKEFGSRWLLLNQISTSSIFENIDRITSGTSLTISRHNFILSKSFNNWLPSIEKDECTIENFSRSLELITFPASNQKISLGLSGGLDSRVLFSYLLISENKNWKTHTFGDENHPDSIIADKIARKSGINHEQINSPLPAADSLINQIKEFISSTMLTSSASAYLQQRHYNELFLRDEIIIDGGFGEIWRRGFFNRMLAAGKNSLRNKKAKELIPYLSLHRADIFNEDIKQQMQEGCEEQILQKLEELPDIDSIGIENFADLFALKTRLVNASSHEQARLDSIVVTYMPFVQLSLLENLFMVKLSLRKNSKMFKKIISKNYPALEKFPLVKGEQFYPYKLNTLQSRIWNRAANKIGLKSYENDISKKMITTLSPFIKDLLNSNEVKECGYYNIKKLNKLAAALDKNDLSSNDINEIDWWLAFELFRQQIN